jgi:short subunit dehydrogenase-like uncharacterized protein
VSSKKTSWMIYGANGYSGRLIAQAAARLGLQPILGGRSAAVEQVGQQTCLPVRRFDLLDAPATKAALEGVQLVLNCAGPFAHTARPMIEACINAGAHYLDITGEVSVFEYAQTQDARAREAGVVVCPGVGFDVIPTDCLALALKQALPDATELALGFDTRSGLSPGTAKTIIENLAQGGKVRRQGKLVTVPNGWHRRRIDFGYGPKTAMTIPWGDVSSAFVTTGIPDIRVYMPAPAPMIHLSRWTDWSRGLFAYRPIQQVLSVLVEQLVKGPDEQQRAKSGMAVWGEVRNARGEVRTGRIKTANGYDLTINGALAVAQWLLANKAESGYQTPARMMGTQLVEQLPGSGKLTIQ